jgi:hypothetical protein
MYMMRTLALLTFVLGLVLSAETTLAQQADKSEPKKPVTVTADDVTYVVAKSLIGADGRKWTIVLEATSKTGDKKILIQSARAIDAEGKTYAVKSPMGKKAVSLSEGTKILIELKMGDLPKNVKSLPRVELLGDRTVGIPGFDKPGGAFSKKDGRPLVLKDVPVERPGEVSRVEPT